MCGGKQRGRDSNPRWEGCSHTCFRGRRDKPDSATSLGVRRHGIAAETRRLELRSRGIAPAYPCSRRAPHPAGSSPWGSTADRRARAVVGEGCVAGRDDGRIPPGPSAFTHLCGPHGRSPRMPATVAPTVLHRCSAVLLDQPLSARVRMLSHQGGDRRQAASGDWPGTCSSVVPRRSPPRDRLPVISLPLSCLATPSRGVEVLMRTGCDHVRAANASRRSWYGRIRSTADERVWPTRSIALRAASCMSGDRSGGLPPVHRGT